MAESRRGPAAPKKRKHGPAFYVPDACDGAGAGEDAGANVVDMTGADDVEEAGPALEPALEAAAPGVQGASEGARAGIDTKLASSPDQLAVVFTAGAKPPWGPAVQVPNPQRTGACKTLREAEHTNAERRPWVVAGGKYDTPPPSNVAPYVPPGPEAAGGLRVGDVVQVHCAGIREPNKPVSVPRGVLYYVSRTCLAPAAHLPRTCLAPASHLPRKSCGLSGARAFYVWRRVESVPALLPLAATCVIADAAVPESRQACR